MAYVRSVNNELYREQALENEASIIGPIPEGSREFVAVPTLYQERAFDVEDARSKLAVARVRLVLRQVT